jgi:hypothetical protein
VLFQPSFTGEFRVHCTMIGDYKWSYLVVNLYMKVVL